MLRAPEQMHAEAPSLNPHLLLAPIRVGVSAAQVLLDGLEPHALQLFSDDLLVGL
jgi:hypothetical protein